MRIWQIAESYPPDYGGGAAIALRDVCQALAERGHEVRVLCTERRDGADPYDVRSDNDGPIRVHRVNLPYFRSHDPEGWQLGLRKWREHERRVSSLIEAALTDWRPAIVDYNTTRPLGEECLIGIGREGVPIVGTLHDAWLICTRMTLHRSPTGEICSGPRAFKCRECMYSHYDGSHLRAGLKMSWRLPRLGAYPEYRIRRRAQARSQVSGAIALSDFMARAHRAHIRGPVIHLPLGLNLSGLPAKHQHRPRTPLRFGFMGGFQPIKGVWDVLDAAAALKAEGGEFELHIWGPEQGAAKEEIARRGLQDRVSLRGVYGPEDVWSAYEAIDVAIVATTVADNFPLIPLEAAAAGAPTIGARAGGIPEQIQDGVNGLLYDFRDSVDLQRQMQRILEEPGLFQKLSDGLSPPVDTRTRGAAVEAAYRRVLKST